METVHFGVSRPVVALCGEPVPSRGGQAYVRLKRIDEVNCEKCLEELKVTLSS